MLAPCKANYAVSRAEPYVLVIGLLDTQSRKGTLKGRSFALKVTCDPGNKPLRLF